MLLQVTVLEIASLKRVGKGTKLLILDSNGGGAKDIAKGLSGRGFRNVFVVQGGYSGWTSSKLQTKNSSSVCRCLASNAAAHQHACMIRASTGTVHKYNAYHTLAWLL